MSNVLLIEDNPADAYLAQMMIEERIEGTEIHHVVNGEKAVEFLNQMGDFRDAPRPDLVLVDINLPGMDGFSVMTEINKNSALREVPMIVLTTSSQPQDRRQAMELGAKEFIVKAEGRDQWDQITGKFTRVMKQARDSIARRLTLLSRLMDAITPTPVPRFQGNV